MRCPNEVDSLYILVSPWYDPNTRCSVLSWLTNWKLNKSFYTEVIPVHCSQLNDKYNIWRRGDQGRMNRDVGVLLKPLSKYKISKSLVGRRYRWIIYHIIPSNTVYWVNTWNFQAVDLVDHANLAIGFHHSLLPSLTTETFQASSSNFLKVVWCDYRQLSPNFKFSSVPSINSTGTNPQWYLQMTDVDL